MQNLECKFINVGVQHYTRIKYNNIIETALSFTENEHYTMIVIFYIDNSRYSQKRRNKIYIEWKTIRISIERKFSNNILLLSIWIMACTTYMTLYCTLLYHRGVLNRNILYNIELGKVLENPNSRFSKPKIQIIFKLMF